MGAGGAARTCYRRLTAWVQLGWQEEVGLVGEWVVSDGQGAGCSKARQPRGLTKHLPWNRAWHDGGRQ